MDLSSRIRELILGGELVPNQRLVEADLAIEFAVSRAAVREALSELAGEGLVERIQNRGARVRSFSLPEAIEILEARQVLEVLCAGKAAQSIADDQVLHLRRIGEEMQEAVADGDLETYSGKNRELHAMVHEISGQLTARALIEKLRGQNVRHQYRLAMKRGRPAVSLREHLEIIEAICSRDVATAERAMRLHLESVIQAVREFDPAQRAEVEL